MDMSDENQNSIQEISPLSPVLRFRNSSIINNTWKLIDHQQTNLKEFVEKNSLEEKKYEVLEILSGLALEYMKNNEYVKDIKQVGRL